MPDTSLAERAEASIGFLLIVASRHVPEFHLDQIISQSCGAAAPLSWTLSGWRCGFIDGTGHVRTWKLGTCSTILYRHSSAA
jgi:hypothetical protein